MGGLGIPGMGMGGGRDGSDPGLGGLGGSMGSPGLGSRLGAGRMGGGRGGLGGLDDMAGMGGNIDSLTESLLSNLSKLGPDFFKGGDEDSTTGDGKGEHVNGDSDAQGGQSSPKPRTGTWSGMGIQSNLTDDSAKGA